MDYLKDSNQPKPTKNDEEHLSVTVKRKQAIMHRMALGLRQELHIKKGLGFPDPVT